MLRGNYPDKFNEELFRAIVAPDQEIGDHSSSEALLAILKKGANPNAQFKFENAAIKALLLNRADLAIILLNHGANADCYAMLGMSLLMIAVINACQETQSDKLIYENIIDVILKSENIRSFINYQLVDKSNSLFHGVGNTALIIAASHGASVLVDQLIDAGANPCLRNNEGLSAADCALYNEYPELAEHLILAETKYLSPQLGLTPSEDDDVQMASVVMGGESSNSVTLPANPFEKPVLESSVFEKMPSLLVQSSLWGSAPVLPLQTLASPSARAANAENVRSVLVKIDAYIKECKFKVTSWWGASDGTPGHIQEIQDKRILADIESCSEEEINEKFALLMSVMHKPDGILTGLTRHKETTKIYEDIKDLLAAVPVSAMTLAINVASASQSEPVAAAASDVSPKP